MTEPLALLRLLQTTDSAFPSGAFAFSGGLETLCDEGQITDADGLAETLRVQIVPRWLSFDRAFLAAAHAAAGHCEALIEIDRDCEAHQTVAPLAEASRRVGRGLLGTHARIGTPGASDHLACLREGHAPGHAPVAQGLIGAGLGCGRAETEAGALYALMAGVASVGIRLGKIGALTGQEILGRLLAETAPALAAAPPETPSSFAPLIDIAACRRDGQSARLFAT